MNKKSERERKKEIERKGKIEIKVTEKDCESDRDRKTVNMKELNLIERESDRVKKRESKRKKMTER